MRSAIFQLGCFILIIAGTQCSGACGKHRPARMIWVNAGPWFVHIRADGSAVYGYGAGGPYSGSLPPGTYDFQQLAATLTPKLTPKPGEGRTFSVTVFDEGESSKRGSYTQDEDTIREIFQVAFAERRPPELLALWEERSPFAVHSPTTRGVKD